MANLRASLELDWVLPERVLVQLVLKTGSFFASRSFSRAKHAKLAFPFAELLEAFLCARVSVIYAGSLAGGA